MFVATNTYLLLVAAHASDREDIIRKAMGPKRNPSTSIQNTDHADSKQVAQQMQHVALIVVTPVMDATSLRRKQPGFR